MKKHSYISIAFLAVASLAWLSCISAPGPGEMLHRNVTPATVVTTNAWLSVKDRVYEAVGDTNLVYDAISASARASTNYANSVAVSATNYTDAAIAAIPAVDLTPATNYANTVARAATNYTDSSIAAIPPPDFTTSNPVLVATIEATAPPPGNYATVSNRAMTALQQHQSLAPATNYANSVAMSATNYTDSVASGKADKSDVYTKAETDAKIVELAPPPGNYETVSNMAMTAIQSLAPATNYTDTVASRKQDNLPYPTNSIPYAVISDTPDLTVYATKEALASAASASTNFTEKASASVAASATNYADTASSRAAVAATNYTDNAIAAIPAVDMTSATNYANSVARSATNYTDSVASRKQDALTAAQTNAINSGVTSGKVATWDGYAQTISGKQDKLPYPTNAIPYAVIANTPDLTVYATKTALDSAAGAGTNYADSVARSATNYTDAVSRQSQQYVDQRDAVVANAATNYVDSVRRDAVLWHDNTISNIAMVSGEHNDIGAGSIAFGLPFTIDDTYIYAGNNSIVFGNYTTVGSGSISIGSENSLEDNSAAFGYGIIAGGSSLVAGLENKGRDYCYLFGRGNFARESEGGLPYGNGKDFAFMQGFYNWTEADAVFMMGAAHHAGSSANLSFSLGTSTSAQHPGAFVWNFFPTNYFSLDDEGFMNLPKYSSHGMGTFNVNPIGGLDGFWIGETNMTTHIQGIVAQGLIAIIPYIDEHDGETLLAATNYANSVARSATNYTDAVASGKADASNVYTKAETDAKIVELAPAPGNYETVSNRAMTAIQSLQPSTNYTDFAISTNNPAFVTAVTNCPVVIAPIDESTMGEFGEYGTLGALLAALAAAITWLRSHKADKTEVPYSIVIPTVTNGEAALSDRAINVIPQATEFSSVLLPSGTSGKARDLVLRINLSAETYIGFSSVDASGNVVQWAKGDPSGTFPVGESLIGISEISEGVFTASNQYALYGVEDLLHTVNSGVLSRLLEANYGITPQNEGGGS